MKLPPPRATRSSTGSSLSPPPATAPLRTYRAAFTIVNAESIKRELRIGMSAEVTLANSAPSGKQNQLPLAALISTGKEVSVWVIAADRLRKQPVSVISTGDGRATVEGLAQGTHVVIAGTDKLNTDMMVRPILRTGTGYEPQ